MVMFEYFEENWALYKVIIMPYNKNTEFISNYLRTVDLNLSKAYNTLCPILLHSLGYNSTYFR